MLLRDFPDDDALHQLPVTRIAAFETNREAVDRHAVIREIDMTKLTAPQVAQLEEIIADFSVEKEAFLRLFETRKWRRFCIGTRWRTMRDELRAARRRQIAMLPEEEQKTQTLSKTGLLEKHWKNALEEAAEIYERYWRAIQVAAQNFLRGRFFYDTLNDAERYYIGCLLGKLTDRFFDLLDGKTPAPVVKKGIEETVRDAKNLAAKVRAVVRDCMGCYPRSVTARSCVFDEDSYRLLTDENGVQTLELMSKVQRQRIPVRLMGTGPVKKTIRLVKTDRGLVVHVAEPLKVKPLKDIPACVDKKHVWTTAFDMGLTEVFTSDSGEIFGATLGEVVGKYAETLDAKLKERNQLQAYYRTSTDPRVKANLKRFNLGDKAWNAMVHRFKVQLANIVNQAINRMMKVHPSDAFIVEAFGRFFSMQGRSKALCRKLTKWIRGIIAERLEYKAAARGIKLIYVPASYSSQRCPVCGYVDKENRHGDKAKCRCCGHEAQADENAAVNLLLAAHDERMRRYLTKEKVRAVYDAEYRKRSREEHSAVAAGE